MRFRHFAPAEALLYAIALILCLVGIAYGLSGCASRKACERRWGPCGYGYVSVQTKAVPWTISLPGAKVDTRVALWQSAYTELRHDTLTYTDSTGRAQLTLALDSLGNLYARCQALPVRVDTTVVEVTRTERVVDTVTNTVTPWWSWAVIGTLATLLLLTLARRWIG